MPTRILLRLFLLLAGLAAPWCVVALGVGQLEVRSALNQLFEAELPLITSNPAELTGLVARIPRQDEFNRAGVERLEFLSKLRFSVQTSPGGRSVVKVTSVEPIREPNFNLLLELVWSRGRMIREFTVQLDPELYANRQQLPAPPPVIAAPPPPVVAPPVASPPPVVPQLPSAPPVSFEGASFYGPVRPGETLAAIANRVRPSTAISLPQMMAILMAGNPAAFTNSNPNTLRSGATLKVPTPQALGVSATGPVPELAAAPPTTGPVVAPAPTSLTPPGPPATPPPELASPPVTAGLVAPPSPITTTPLPATPAADVTPPAASPVAESSSAARSLSPAEQPREIVPQATIPQPEPSPPPAAAPAPVAPPAAAPAAPPPRPRPAAPPTEAEPSWMSNPVVWVAIALIVLAIAALILLPLLRRPARMRMPPEGRAIAPESLEGESTAVVEPKTVPSRIPLREPGSVRPRPAAGVTTTSAVPVPAKAELAPGPVGAPAPKPIGELLKDFDFDLGDGRQPPAIAARQDATPARDIKAPLLEAEPPTASVTRRPINSFVETLAEQPEQEKEQQRKNEPATSRRAEEPSELRLDGLDFDLGDLGLGRSAGPQPSELPPLEMKSGAAGAASKLPELSPLDLGIAEPATGSPSLASAAAAPTGSPVPAMKFEFADVTQEIARHGAHEDSLKLDEALRDLGGNTLKLGGQEEGIGIGSVSGRGGMDTADYVETKLDLASAYLDMGDHVGARSLLEEVLREGDARQKQRAGEFLKKLG